MKIIVIADTHMFHKSLEIPEGDVLIHCGDMTSSSRPKDIINFNAWLRELPFPRDRILCIAGNHDYLFQKDPSLARMLLKDCIYLQDEAYEIDGIKFYGSPWTKLFGNWAFEIPGHEREKVWSRVPDNTDVLITHAPPYGIGDENRTGIKCGDKYLLREVTERIKPQFAVHGHIHESWGKTEINGTTFINASIMNAEYKPLNAPFLIEI